MAVDVSTQGTDAGLDELAHQAGYASYDEWKQADPFNATQATNHLTGTQGQSYTPWKQILTDFAVPVGAFAAAGLAGSAAAGASGATAGGTSAATPSLAGGVTGLGSGGTLAGGAALPGATTLAAAPSVASVAGTSALNAAVPVFHATTTAPLMGGASFLGAAAPAAAAATVPVVAGGASSATPPPQPAWQGPQPNPSGVNPSLADGTPRPGMAPGAGVGPSGYGTLTNYLNPRSPQGMLLGNAINTGLQLYGAHRSADAAQNAAAIQQAAAQKAIDYGEQRRQETAALYQPYIQGGQAAFQRLTDGLGQAAQGQGPYAPAANTFVPPPLPNIPGVPTYRNGGPITPPPGMALVPMQAPDGSVQSVPASQVPYWQSRGATPLGGR